MNAKSYRLAEFEAQDRANWDYGWPSSVAECGDVPLVLHRALNKESNQGEATYVDVDDNFYILTKLRSGHIVGAIEEGK